MPLRDICVLGDPVLETVATPVAAFDDDLVALVTDMFETMYAAPGRGLAAPQVSVSKRLFVVDTDWKEGAPAPMIFINPVITARSDEMVMGSEACLSIPGRSFDVMRPAWIEVTWQDLDGGTLSRRFDGVKAVCICHENDHLDGRLITMTGVET